MFKNRIFIYLCLFFLIVVCGASEGFAARQNFKAAKSSPVSVKFGDLELTVPIGATDQEMTVSWGDGDLREIKLPFGFYALSKPYRFGPHGLQFPNDKTIHFSLKIDQTALHKGDSLEQVKLYYINHDTKNLELVDNQSVNATSGKLQADLKHFSDYVIGITAGWDGYGINPFSDYINDGEEHINLASLNVSVVSPVVNQKGRGMDTVIGRSYSCGFFKISSEPFVIDGKWNWSLLGFSGGTNTYKLTLPGGITYSDSKACPIVFKLLYNTQVSVSMGTSTTYKIYYGIVLNDGTTILDNGTTETITDTKGNVITYYFTSYTVYHTITVTTSSTKHTTTISTTAKRIYKMVDTVGRIFNFVYQQSDKYSDPVLKKLQQQLPDGSLKTILTYDGSGVFTDALGRQTTYSYYSSDNGFLNGHLVSVYYTNGAHTEYTFTSNEKEVYTSLLGGSIYKTLIQKFYESNASTAFKTITYNYTAKYNGAIYTAYSTTVNDGISYKEYSFDTDSPWLTTKEKDYDLSGNLKKRVTKSYSSNRPTSIKTELVKTDGTTTAATYAYAYDDWGNITKATDPNGTIKYMAYANSGSTTSLSSINSKLQDALYTTGAGYNQLITKATLVTDSIHGTTQLNQTHYQYDTTGNLLKESVVYNGSTLDTTYTYDSYGNMLTKTDPLGNSLLFTYSSGLTGINDGAYLTKVSSQNSAGIATVLVIYSDFNEMGKPTAAIDPNGNVFTYSYDAIGRCNKQAVASSDKNAAVTKVVNYDDTGSLITIFYGNTDKGWQVGRINYDPLLGKPAELLRLPSLLSCSGDESSDLLTVLGTSPSWQTTKTITYDSNGRTATESDGVGNTTTYSYDALDRVIKTVFPDGTYSVATWSGWDVTKYDANGNLRDESYDLLNRLSSVKEYPDNTDSDTYYVTGYTYDSANHLVQVINPNSASTQYTYDNLGQLTETDFPQDGTNPLTAETYTYDSCGNLLTKTNANGTKTTDYEFLGGYRVKQVTEPDNSTVSYTYDNNNNVLTQTSAGATYTYSNYDVRNRAHNMTALIDSNSFALSYEYDTFGRITCITYPGRTDAITFDYDALDRLTDIPDFVTACAYDDDNRPTAMTYTNGISTTWAYNYQHLKTINIGSLLNLSYTYDYSGNISQITTVKNSAITTNDYYYFDGLNRLTGYKDGSATNKYIFWNYDGAGNISGKTSYESGIRQTTSLTYDLANRLWSMGSTTYTNDAAGNRTGKAGTNTWVYNYDKESRLTSVYKDGTDVLDNTYDGSGMRVKQVGNGKTTYYVYQGNNPIMEYNGTSGVYTYFIYAGNKLVAEEKDGVVKYYHQDHLGSTRVITDSTGAEVAYYKYAPYGEKDSYSGTDTTNYQFTGKEVNEDIGLTYFGARFYDAEAGRFLTPDTYTNLPNDERILFNSVESKEEYKILKIGVKYPEVQNVYSFCLNNPLRFIDLTGNDAEDTTNDDNNSKNSEKSDEDQTVTVKDPPPAKSGYESPKGGARQGRTSDGQKGWVDKNGNIWVPAPTGSRTAHGGGHWDVQNPRGGYDNVFPNGHVIPGSGPRGSMSPPGARMDRDAFAVGLGGLAVVGYCVYEVVKDIIAIGGAPETCGASLSLLAVP